jgi:hypothetical protein
LGIPREWLRADYGLLSVLVDDDLEQVALRQPVHVDFEMVEPLWLEKLQGRVEPVPYRNVVRLIASAISVAVACGPHFSKYFLIVTS